MKFPSRNEQFAISSVLGACLILLSGCNAAHHAIEVPEPKISGDTVTMPPGSPQCAALTVEPVGSGQTAFVPLTARLAWDDDVTARVFTPFAGIIRKLPAEINEPVAKGAPLAEIQSADFGQAQADARRAESQFRLAQRNLDRLKDLFDHGAAPRKDLESAEADFASAQAEKDRAATRLAIYGATASSINQMFLLPSPLDGILVERNVTPGQEVRPDQMLANMPQITAPLFTITDPTKLWVWLDVTEINLGLVHEGQSLIVRSKAFTGQAFKGQLEMISGSLDPTKRTVLARGRVDNSSRLLKAELYVTVEIPDVASQNLQVPSKAVFLRNNQYFVFLEVASGQFQRHPVKLGSEREGKVAILEGLQQGQRLVTEGCLLLQSLMDNAPQS
jgi:cobalt-zinc-cadmium efflux system membrane fusion protein